MRAQLDRRERAVLVGAVAACLCGVAVMVLTRNRVETMVGVLLASVMGYWWPRF